MIAPTNSILFANGFYEVAERLPNDFVRAKCQACVRSGRAHSILSPEMDHSCLISHLSVSDSRVVDVGSIS